METILYSLTHGGVLLVRADRIQLFAQSSPLRRPLPPRPSLSTVQNGGAKLPAAQSVTVRDGSTTPAYTVATPPGDPWLIATPFAGNLPGAVAVQVNPSTLPPGIYVSTVTVTVTGVA